MSGHVSTSTSAGSVSLAWTLPTGPDRAAAFQQAMTAILHASFSCGQQRPAQLVYSYDPHGDEYAETLVAPAGTIASMSDAIAWLCQSASGYNHSIGFSFAAAHRHVPVTGRVYDDPDALVMSLDFDAASWRQLVRSQRSTRGATTALLDAGRVLFTLLPLRYLLIGPTPNLLELPRVPTARLLHAAPIALLGKDLCRRKRSCPEQPLHLESLPGGQLIVQHWDASCTPQHTTTRRSRTAVASKKL